MSHPVITRFAPSPTGFLHIGGARTALFNWLYAKANNGVMLLRIEDTDRERSNKEAVDAILDGLTWLGLDWEGEAISQFARADRHAEIAHKMLETGAAYPCTATPEELTAMRDKAKAEGRSPRFDEAYRSKTLADIDPGQSYVIRLKAPQEGETVVEDQVQGTVRIANKDLDDFVLLRSDGTPTYMLAVVVDDHDMNVTHVIRGDDHLINAARQTLIYSAMGWDVPVMAHIPLIHGADGAKLSKRHGAIGAEAYRAMGYLPEALRNYLVRLGWSHGDTEIMSTEQMIEWFGFDGMNKAAARFDFTKLEALNAHYLREASPEELLAYLERILPEIEGGEKIARHMNTQTRETFLRAKPALAERSKTLVDLVSASRFVFTERPVQLDEKAKSLLDETGRNSVLHLHDRFLEIDQWNAETIAATIRGYAEENEMKLGQVAQPVRAALTGMASSPGAFDVLEILGQKESLARLDDVKNNLT